MKNLSQLIAEGKYLFKSQKYRQAEELFKLVLKQRKEFADVQNYMGLIAYQDGRFGEAIGYFKKALSINPRYTEALLNLSILYNDVGDHDSAKKLVERQRRDAKSVGTRMDPFIRSKLANKHAEVADLYHGVGAFREAVDEYKKALALEEGYVDLKTQMAICLRENGDVKTALEELKEAVKKNGRFADAQIQLGVTQFALGKKAEAKKTWQSVVKKFPTNKTVKMYLRLAGAR